MPRRTTDASLSCSWAPGLVGRLTIWPYNINYHREHHARPKVPWDRLPAAFPAARQRPGRDLLAHLWSGVTPMTSRTVILVQGEHLVPDHEPSWSALGRYGRANLAVTVAQVVVWAALLTAIDSRVAALERACGRARPLLPDDAGRLHHAPRVLPPQRASQPAAQLPDRLLDVDDVRDGADAVAGAALGPSPAEQDRGRACRVHPRRREPDGENGDVLRGDSRRHLAGVFRVPAHLAAAALLDRSGARASRALQQLRRWLRRVQRARLASDADRRAVVAVVLGRRCCGSAPGTGRRWRSPTRRSGSAGLRSSGSTTCTRPCTSWKAPTICARRASSGCSFSTSTTTSRIIGGRRCRGRSSTRERFEGDPADLASVFAGVPSAGDFPSDQSVLEKRYF